MKYRIRTPKAKRVAEPVQVYLGSADRTRLDRLTTRLAATKSDVLRQALEALDAATRPGNTPAARHALPTYRGRGLRPGVDLDSGASLRDLMDRDDAAD